MREMKDSGIEWIGEIPKDKNIIRNKYLFEYTKGKLPSNTNSSGVGFPYIGASDLDSKEQCQTYTTDESLPNVVYDDLLILWDGARAGLCGTHNKGKVSSTVMRVRGNKDLIYQPFLYWYYKGFEWYMYQSVGGTTIPHMNRKYIEEIHMIDWPLSEQQRIASYLDSKCSKIDDIIEKQQSVIEKLKAYKQSIITEAVTKGLNPDVPMKDSGVEWIGEVPEHWIQASLSVGLNLIQTGPFGSQLHAEDYIENGRISLINPANIQNGVIVADKRCTITEEKANDLSQHILKVGNIVFARRGEMGRCACVSDKENTYFCGTGCIKLICNDRLDPYFAIKYLQTSYIKQYLELNSVGTTMANLNSSIISKIPTLFPPMNEQENIVKFLDQKCSAIDSTIANKQALIEKLTAYKKSLIYEVVTGKKEV